MSHEVISVDIVYGASYGDESKGKVSNFLSSQPSRAAKIFGTNDKHYNFVARWGGGQNAGHTIFVNGKKYKTHMVPAGVFHGITSLIGPGCVVNLELLKEEFNYLRESGFDPSLVKISPAAHIVTGEHIEADKRALAKKLGTTSKGIAPAYADKYARTGIKFKEVAALDSFWRTHLFDGRLFGNILCEGAQGFFLDINWGNYPYVTSSETLPYAACSLGFSPKKIRNIYAIAKMYDTRSGEDPDFPETLLDNPELLSIADAGQEYGTTTGRRRKVNYLNLDKLIFALNTAGGNYLITSKCDILEKVKVFKLFYKNELLSFNSLSLMKEFVTARLSVECPELERIYFSSSSEIIEGFTF
jgi:adenylosuccinate synthase